MGNRHGLLVPSITTDQELAGADVETPVALSMFVTEGCDFFMNFNDTVGHWSLAYNFLMIHNTYRPREGYIRMLPLKSYSNLSSHAPELSSDDIFPLRRVYVNFGMTNLHSMCSPW